LALETENIMGIGLKYGGAKLWEKIVAWIVKTAANS
jgi:hypothetical protein